MTDHNHHDLSAKQTRAAVPTSVSDEHLGPSQELDDPPPAFFTIECRDPDTGTVVRVSNLPSRQERRRLQRQARKRNRRRRGPRTA